MPDPKPADDNKPPVTDPKPAEEPKADEPEVNLTQKMPTQEMAASPKEQMARQSKGGRLFTILHDAVGPGYNVFTKGQVVREEDMKHEIGAGGSLYVYSWDLDRLIALGAIEEMDAKSVREGQIVGRGEQYAPPPDLPEGKEPPKGGTPKGSTAKDET